MNSEALKNDLIDSVKKNLQPFTDLLIGARLVFAQSGGIGIASAITECQNGSFPEAGHLHELDPLEILEFLKSPVLLKASLGMAAVNSLQDTATNMNSGNAFHYIREQAAGKSVAVIGHFPFVDKLREIASSCLVFERRPHDGDLPAEAIGQYLPACQIVVITAQTITNGSIGQILDLSKNAFKILLGPSAPLSPVLFDYGIDIIGGTRITDAGLVRRYVMQGAYSRQLQGTERICMFKNGR